MAASMGTSMTILCLSRVSVSSSTFMSAPNLLWRAMSDFAMASLGFGPFLTHGYQLPGVLKSASMGLSAALGCMLDSWNGL